MKAVCKKQDPLGVIKVGETYNLTQVGRNHIVDGRGFAISKENLKEYFVWEEED